MSQVLDKSKQIRKPAAGRAAEAIEITPTIKLRDLAEKLGMEPADLQKELMNYNFFGGINQAVGASYATKIAEKHGRKVVVKAAAPPAPAPTKRIVVQPPKPTANLMERPPVVTILGHVDHGKTTLLDYIRKTRVAEGEFGGITQRIGAYQVDLPGKGKITFIDTPGHAAFTAMRARGAKATDIAVLVVAADDGVMPQTREAYEHARAAGVPIIVALNKVDIEGLNIDRVLSQLSDLGLVAEEWGGETIVVRLSAKTGDGVEDLLDYIHLVSTSLLELRADPKAKATGVVLEAEVDRGLGPVATVLIKDGTLSRGDAIVIGGTSGRIKFMLDDTGKQVPKAPPSAAVRIVGLSGVPDVGDTLQIAVDEKAARVIAEGRSQERKEQLQDGGRRTTLEDVIMKIRQGEARQLNVILKADNQGSVEAAADALVQQGNDIVKIHVVSSAVGPVSETDVLLATASEAIIVGFNTRIDPRAKRAAEDSAVSVKTYKIIYEMLDEVALAAQGLLKPVYQEFVVGHAEIRQIFRLPGNNRIAGCMVTDGRIARSDSVRVKRGGAATWEGKIDSLRRVKEDAREVAQGYECGIVLDGYNDIQEGDVVEAFVMQEVGRK